jgi:uncharacterized protein
MKLDLTEIAFHLGKRISYEIDEPPLVDEESGLRCVEGIRGKVSFSNTGSVIVVRGRFQTVIELECTRCLSAFRMDIDLPIEEGLPLASKVPPPDEESEDELPEEEKEPLFVDNIFNLSEYLRQAIVVSIPIRTLCSEQCSGLCSRCGKNLNEGPCQCEPEGNDSPFAALKSLLEVPQNEDGAD